MKKKLSKAVGSRRELAIDWQADATFEVPIPHDEADRVADLHRFEVLDTPPDIELDQITRLAAQICGTPIALITLVDSDRQWFKSKIGITIDETSRDIAFCAHAIMQHELFIVPDATKDRRFARNPLVQSSPHIRFYAGAPLVSPDQHALGTLCVIDRVPRRLTAEQKDALRALSALVMSHLELHRQIELQRDALAEQARERRAQKRPGRAGAAGGKARGESNRQAGQEVRAHAQTLLTVLRRASALGSNPEQRLLLKTARSSVAALLVISRQLAKASGKSIRARR